MKSSNFIDNESIKKDVREVNTLLENNLKGYIGDIPKEHIYLNSLSDYKQKELIKKSLGSFFSKKSKYIIVYHNTTIGDGFYSILDKTDKMRMLKQYTSLFFLSLYIKRKKIKFSEVFLSNSYNYKGV